MPGRLETDCVSPPRARERESYLDSVLMITSSLASSPGSRFHSLTEEVKLTAPGEGKSLPFGGFHALCKNEEACSITLTHISALNAAACGPEPVSSD